MAKTTHCINPAVKRSSGRKSWRKFSKFPAPRDKGRRKRIWRTKKELETIAYALGISEAHKERRIIAAAHCKEMMELIKTNGCLAGDSITLLKAFNAGVAAEIHQQTVQELGENS